MRVIESKKMGGREAEPKPNISFISSFLMVDNCGCAVLVLVVGVLVAVGCRLSNTDC